MSLLETEVPIRDVITTDPETANALENDLRAKILDMLAEQELTIAAIHDELDRRGETKAETTVRHHVDVLKDADMVELARLEEAGGGTRKHYRSNTRVFSYDLPADAEETLAAAFARIRGDLETVLDEVLDEHGDDIEAVAREMKPCEYCDTQHYEEFILRELVDRSLTDLVENGDIAEFSE
jgi:DNA-binding transcriptional ArsR family regulator